MQKHVWIAVPAYTGTVHLATMRSIISEVLLLRDAGVAFTFHDETGSALIGDCRALVCAKFLASGATDLVFVDSDVAWEAGALLKLVNHPVDFVAGIYPQRCEPESYPVSWMLTRDTLQADPETGLLEVEGVPAGFTRMSRAMLEKMVGFYPNTEFYSADAPNERAWALFDPYRIGKLKLGEDYAFCRRWRDIGGKVWVDPEIRMGHIGNKAFSGHLGNWLRGRT